MENMELWNKVSIPPADALKKIGGGNLSGFTDINPQWRYRTLTEHFGSYGIGWKYTVDKKWSEPGVDGTIMAFADVSLYVHYNDQPKHFDEHALYWCDPIPGHGGSMLVIKDRNGLHASDEAYKMAITDALSVACKMLGIGSAVYEGKMDGGNRPSGTKYDRAFDQTPPEDRPHQTANGVPRSQPAARPPAARPETRPASQPQTTQQQVPTTAQVNHGLKTGAQVAADMNQPIGDNSDQFDKLKDAAVKGKIPIKQYKAWLKGVYGYEGSAQILKSKYPAILEILLKHPDVVKKYGMDPAVKQTPPPPRQPGQDEEEVPLPEPPPGV
jgi:hypothetical protein